jgi:hypothetical protein
MEEELNALIGKYGIIVVHSSIEQRIKEEYNYLRKIFEKKMVEPKPIKETRPEIPESVPNKPEVVSTIPIEQTDNTEPTEKKFKDPKEMKKWQKEMEEKKRIEQESKGIKPLELLTKENLQKWYGEEGRTFSYISREYVGCKDSEVSNAVKTFGITNTRKNVIVRGLIQKKK